MGPAYTTEFNAHLICEREAILKGMNEITTEVVFWSLNVTPARRNGRVKKMVERRGEFAVTVTELALPHVK